MKKIDYIEDFAAWRKNFHFFIPIQVRFCETDMFGHLNNTVPFIYFEQVRIAFLKHLGFTDEWKRDNNQVIPVVANLQCDYLQQVFFDEIINMFVKVNKVGQSSLDLHYMAEKADGKICFTGRGTLVKLNKNTGKGEKWSNKEIMLLEKQTSNVL